MAAGIANLFSFSCLLRLLLAEKGETILSWPCLPAPPSCQRLLRGFHKALRSKRPFTGSRDRDPEKVSRGFLSLVATIHFSPFTGECFTVQQEGSFCPFTYSLGHASLIHSIHTNTFTPFTRIVTKFRPSVSKYLKRS